MRPRRVGIWFAMAGAFMAVIFLALGHVLPEPSDHPRWLMTGSRPVLICYTVLIGFCAPVVCLYGLLLDGLQTCGLVSSDFYALLWRLRFVAYPLMQGTIYGGGAWMMVLLGNVVRDMLSRRCMSRDSSTDAIRDSGLENSPGSESAPSHAKAQTTATSSWRTRRTLLAVAALVVILYSIVSVLVLLPILPSTWTMDYDRDRYTEIHEAIKADDHHLLGKSLDEISKRFGLEGVPWDDDFFQLGPPGSRRIYHFRGFALYMIVDWGLPEDSPLRQSGQYAVSGSDLRRYGTLQLAYSPPYVRADGINDPKERMKRYWDAIDEECARINAEMERERQERGR